MKRIASVCANKQSNLHIARRQQGVAKLYKHTANPKLTKQICPDAAARMMKTAIEIVSYKV